MRRNPSWLWATAAVLLAASRTLASEPTEPVLHQNPARIEHFTYPKGQTPIVATGYPIAEANGVCSYRFLFRVEMEAQPSRLGFGSTTVETLVVTTDLDITVWQQEGSGPAIASHEETHRRIAEYYYTLAPAVVAECGKGIIGQKWKVPITKDRDATLKRRIHEVEERLESDCIRALVDRCNAAENAFDELTDHGRKAIPVDQAMSQCIAEETAAYAKRTHP